MMQKLAGPPRSIDRKTAEDFANCFKALADATRIQIVSVLAAASDPITVGELTKRVGVGQSTVSHHLKALAQVEFVLVESIGTSNLYRLNETCAACFPTAADILTGNPPNLPASTCQDL